MPYDPLHVQLRLKISMSLDGFVAGPEQSVENPLGIGGERLHEWVIPLAAWRSTHGMPGGEVNESSRVVEESIANIGATVMGRNMFGGHPGAWDQRKPWNGCLPMSLAMPSRRVATASTARSCSLRRRAAGSSACSASRATAFASPTSACCKLPV